MIITCHYICSRGTLAWQQWPSLLTHICHLQWPLSLGIYRCVVKFDKWFLVSTPSFHTPRVTTRYPNVPCQRLELPPHIPRWENVPCQRVLTPITMVLQVRTGKIIYLEILKPCNSGIEILLGGITTDKNCYCSLFILSSRDSLNRNYSKLLFFLKTVT